MPESSPPVPEPAAASARASRLPLDVKLAYGLPGLAGAAMAIPIAIHMTKFYADTVGLALGYIALAQALARAFDAITDPLMGWISDRTRTRWGRRRPWMLLGAPLCAVAFVALFTPPRGMDSGAGVIWFTSTFILYFLFHTVYIIPHYGLGPELTLDYHERSSLFAWRDATTLLGTVIAAVLPSVAISRLVDGGMAVDEAERLVYAEFAVVMGVVLVALYVWLCLRVREDPHFYARKSNPLVPGVRRVLGNRPFRLLLVVYMIASVTGAIPGIFVPFYTQYVLKLEDWPFWFGMFLLAYFLSGFVSIPLWLRATRRFGKKETWIASFVLGITASLALFFLPEVVAGRAAIVPMLVILAWAGAGFGAGMFLNPSIQADVIDYDELHTGRRREAQYGAMWNIITKFAVIPSASVPLALLATVGYQPNVAQSEEVQLTIRAIFGLAPAFFSALAMVFAFRFPITESVHRAILRGLDAHRRGEPAEDPLTGWRLPPPDARGLDEETGWFLDHFSPGELRRGLRAGFAGVVRSAQAKAVLSLGVAGLSFVGVLGTLEDLEHKPGPLTVLSVVAGGLALALFAFHAARIRAAGRLRDGLASPEEVKLHLELQARERPGPARDERPARSSGAGEP